MPRRLSVLVFLGFVYIVGSGHSESDGGCCGSDGAHVPAKTGTFTKMIGPNTAKTEGEHTTGVCSPEEVSMSLAGCADGDHLIFCDVDGEPHAVDCSVKLGTDTCKETDTTADCECESGDC